MTSEAPLPPTTPTARRPHPRPQTPVRRRSRTPRRVPSSEFSLTPAERALLPDPDWVTEDDADFIIGYRRRKQPTINFEEYLRRR